MKKVVIFNDFYWCRTHELKKVLKLRFTKDNIEKLNKDYVIEYLPIGMSVPTQKYIEEVIELYFT